MEYETQVKEYGEPVKRTLSAKEQAHSLPHSSGVYLMKDGRGKVIYVGKARDLNRRVRSYFLTGRNVKTQALVQKIHTIEHIVTGNEYEALILENNLIKKYSPKYNIDLKDGKSYPVIRVTNEEFPRVFKTRRVVNDGSRYFGPFPAASQLDDVLRLIHRIYPLRRCSSPLRKRKAPCLYYHMGRCPGPCANLASAGGYRKSISQIVSLLEGDDYRVRTQLEKRMKEEAGKLNFEKAASFRDLLEALKTVTETQQVQDFSQTSRDYAAVELSAGFATVLLMQFRDGRMIGRALYRTTTFAQEAEILTDFLVRYYSDEKRLPSELYLLCEKDRDLLMRYFEEELKFPVEVKVPTEGKHFRILRMAQQNAQNDVLKRVKGVDNSQALAALASLVGLEDPPALIEGFDIAHLAGKYTVASLISFKDGNPDPSGYRRFNMRTLDGRIDDYESMREVIARRYSRVKNERLARPDLIMVDGGAGQVSAAVKMLSALEMDIPVVGLSEKEEKIIFPDGREPVDEDLSHPGLRILIAIRDEAHRFANKANRDARTKELSFRLLESVKGVGPARAKALMQKFGSMDAIRDASVEQIKAAGVPADVADRILKSFTL